MGYVLFKTTEEHGSISLLNKDPHLLVIPEANNIRAELRAVIKALESCKVGTPVVVFTDCQNVVGLPARRKKLEHGGFMSGNTHQPLANTDLYKEFFVQMDRIHPSLVWIKGHSPSKKGRDPVQTNFSQLDRAVRKKLRETLPKK